MNKNEKLECLKKLHYDIKIEKAPEEEGGYYIAHIPELGSGAFIGTGDTIEQALADLEEVKLQFFSEHIDKGLDVPIPSKKSSDFKEFSGRLVLRLPKHLHAMLTTEAQERSTSLNTYITSLLSERYHSVKMCDYIEQFDKKLNSMFLNINRIRTSMEDLSDVRINIGPQESGVDKYLDEIYEHENMSFSKKRAA